MSPSEVAVTIPVPGESLVLEGIWQAGGERGAVIAPPHPEYGGSLENPVVTEIAHALHRNGFASLRFNWRGVGASQGLATGEPGAALADYAAAVEQLACTRPGPILGAGYSFGAATALRAALHDVRIRSLLLVAPPVGMLGALPLERCACPVRILVGADDDFAPVAELQRLCAGLADARIEVIPGADHFFWSAGLGALQRRVRELYP